MQLLRRRLTSATDAELVRRLARGQRAAFDVLYERYSSRLFAYLLRMTGGRHERAEDLLHDVFVDVLEGAVGFDPQRRFDTWLFAIAHHRTCNVYRQQQTRSAALERETNAAQTPALEWSAKLATEEWLFDWPQFKERLDTELNALEPAQRSAFLLRFVENFSIADIARTLACPPGTVKSRLFYTCRHLAKKLRAFDPRPDEEHRP